MRAWSGPTGSIPAAMESCTRSFRTPSEQSKGCGAARRDECRTCAGAGILVGVLIRKFLGALIGMPVAQGWNKRATVEYVLHDYEASLEDCKMCVPLGLGTNP